MERMLRTWSSSILRRRYVMGQSYTDIANAMGVVQRRVYQLHKAGVEKVELPATLPCASGAVRRMPTGSCASA